MVKIKEYITIPNIMLLLLCIGSVSSYIGGPIYYGILVIYCIYRVLSCAKNVKYNKFCIAFIVIALISTLINYPITEPIFRVEQRIITLILVLLAFSPIISSKRIYEFRKKIFLTLLLAITICAIISSIMGMFGIGYILNYLTGLFDFPNALGYAQGICIIYLFYILFYFKNKFLFLICVLGIILSVVSIPLTGTRTAFYSIPIILLGYLFLRSKNIFDFIKYFCIVILLGLFISNFIDIDTSLIDKKNEYQKEYGTSRDGLWKARINEFKDSPILGIGTFRADLRWSEVNSNGNVEAGNSFLMMLSMNGILGFLNFTILYLSLVIPFSKFILYKKNKGLSYFDILISLVTIYNFISMQQAGLILNAGYYTTGINWLSLSLLFNYKKYNNNA